MHIEVQLKTYGQGGEIPIKNANLISFPHEQGKDYTVEIQAFDMKGNAVEGYSTSLRIDVE